MISVTAASEPLVLIAAQMLDALLDRSYMVAAKKAPYPPAGPGYQVMAQTDGAGLLKGIE